MNRRIVMRLALPFVLAACAGPLGSRTWRLPDTPEAKDCLGQCRDTLRMCTSRRTPADLFPERTAHNTSIGNVVDSDTMRAKRCDDAFEACVGACPGAVER